MTKSSVFLLFYFSNLFTGYLCSVDPEIAQENRIKYPWMVIIYDPSSSSTIASYGTIIHERAILTLIKPTIERLKDIKLQVLPNLFFSFTHLPENEAIPAGLKRVKEYHRLEHGSHASLGILVLEESLELRSTVNVIELFRENDRFDPNNCILLSLFTDLTIDPSTSTVNSVIFVTSYAVNLNQTRIDVVTSPNDALVPLDEQRREIQQERDSLAKGIKFIGGPLYCKSQDSENWRQLGVTNLMMKKQGSDHPKLILEGNVLRTDNKTIRSLINEVLKTSDINDFELNERIVRY